MKNSRNTSQKLTLEDIRENICFLIQKFLSVFARKILSLGMCVNCSLF